jgi:hypothetical protein
MTLISDINRARLLRLARTFQEVHAETGSLPRSMAHCARFVGKKMIPLVRYGSFALVRLLVARRVRRENARLAPERAVVGIRILGGIGDYIVIARFLNDLCATIEPSVLDIYSNKPKVAAWIFGSLQGFRASHDESLFAPTEAVYVVAMQISQFVLIDDHWSAPGALRPFPRLQRVVSRIRDFRASIAPIVAEHPRLDSFLAQKAIFSNHSRRDYLHHIAGIAYAGDDYPIASAIGGKTALDLRRRRYVTVHNGYDPNMVVSHERATKCYPHFGDVIALLRQQHPELTFVQIGIHTSIRIKEADVDLLGETSLPEVAGLLRDAVLHIDNEGGLVHLARAVGTPSCVVFGPTSSRYFGYPGNINIDPLFCGGCWWINETWMNHCPRGFNSARCMTEQPASAVARAVGDYLGRFVARGVGSGSGLVAPAPPVHSRVPIPEVEWQAPEYDRHG